jgi:integrase
MSEYDNRIQEYLDKLQPSTKDVAKAATNQFTEFYKAYSLKLNGVEGTVIDFFQQVYDDSKLPPLVQKRVDTNTITAFITFLKERYEDKTVRTYAGALQSLGVYLRIPFSSRFTGLPPPLAVTKKHSWELEEVPKFLDSFDSVLYQAIGCAFFQSGSDVSTLKDVTYGDIQEELEAGVFPICIDMARHKNHIPHYTFLGEWAIKYLRVYLESQSCLKPETPLFPISKQSVDSYFLSRAKVYAGVEKFEHRNPYAPHTLRAAFNTHARDHRSDPIYIPFMMGHQVAEQEKTYVSKTRQGWRETYIFQFEPWLTPQQFRRKELRDIAQAWAKRQGLEY